MNKSSSFDYFERESEGLHSGGLNEVFDGSLRRESESFVEFVHDEDVMHPDIAVYGARDAVLTALTAAGEKNGTMLAATVESIDPVLDQVDVLNTMGLDCWVSADEVEMAGRTLKNARIYATNDERYSKGELDLPFDSNGHEDHQEIGKFFGYPRSEVEAYEENGNWPKGYTFEDGEQKIVDYEEGTDFTFPAHVLSNEHGYDEQTGGKLRTFIPYSITDTEESLERTVKEAESRSQVIDRIEQEYEVEITSRA